MLQLESKDRQDTNQSAIHSECLWQSRNRRWKQLNPKPGRDEDPRLQLVIALGQLSDQDFPAAERFGTLKRNTLGMARKLRGTFA